MTEQEAILELRDALKDALDNCIWNADNYLLGKDEAQRLFDRITDVLGRTVAIGPKKTLQSEYGREFKSPLQLIESFALEMYIQHFIEVKEINFSKDSHDKLISEIANQGLAKYLPKNQVIRIESINTTSGAIKIGVAQEKPKPYCGAV